MIISNLAAHKSKSNSKSNSKEKDSLSKKKSESVDPEKKKPPLLPLSGAARWIALLEQEEAWKEAVAMNSGQGMAFLAHFPRLTEKFALFIRLIGEENTINSLADAQRRFHYWTLNQGRETIRQLCNRITLQPQSPHSPYEQLTNGKRTHDGIPIPDHAPPRPDAVSVWNPLDNRWEK